MAHDPNFMDLTSHFLNGLITKASYVSALAAGYDARPDSSAIRCILCKTTVPNECIVATTAIGAATNRLPPVFAVVPTKSYTPNGP